MNHAYLATHFHFCAFKLEQAGILDGFRKRQLGRGNQLRAQRQERKRAQLPSCTKFSPNSSKNTHELAGLPCCKRAAAASSPASWVRRSRRLRDTLAAAPGLHAHASVTETVKCYPLRCKLRCSVAPTRQTQWRARTFSVASCDT
jgi:hypothetical protein